MTIRIEANSARDLNIAIRLAKRISADVEFSRKAKRIYIDDASAAEFEQLCDEFTARGVECRAIVDECAPGEPLPAGW